MLKRLNWYCLGIFAYNACSDHRKLFQHQHPNYASHFSRQLECLACFLVNCQRFSSTTENAAHVSFIGGQRSSSTTENATHVSSVIYQRCSSSTKSTSHNSLISGQRSSSTIENASHNSFIGCQGSSSTTENASHVSLSKLPGVF